MRIAIDLNDVVRDYSNNFVRYYVEQYNREYNLDNFDLYTNDLKLILPFANDRSYYKFVYEDFSYELFSKCPLTSRNLDTQLREWEDVTLTELDEDDEVKVNVLYVSPFEYGSSIGCTYMFLSKLGTHTREAYLPIDSSSIWDRCDVLITANPLLLENKPDGKVSIKIKTDYNKECEADYEFKTLSSFLSDAENTKKLIKENGDNE